MILGCSDSLETFSMVGAGGADSPEITGAIGDSVLSVMLYPRLSEASLSGSAAQATDSGPWNGEERHCTEVPRWSLK